MLVMFDTNIFSHIREGKIDPSSIPKEWNPIATHIQLDEIQNTRDPVTRKEIEDIFYKHIEHIENTTSAVWGTSNWGQACYSTENSVQEEIFQKLEENRKHKNNMKDSLISDTCYQMGITLVTDDVNLSDVSRSLKIAVINMWKKH